MFKRLLKHFFPNNQLTARNAVLEADFIATHNSHAKSDFEVTELSYDEYVEYAGPERRVATAEVHEERRRVL